MAVDVQALPPGVEERVLQLAASSRLLLFGELHGTREVPTLVAALLPKLAARGYAALGLEVPRDQQAALLAWADGQVDQPPP
ncbi:MAG: ChaN family lipoprotein, partial [Chloroflexota bacterium]|nr:ChaN family lipoprotein [Chloroflexota bacterium]